MLSVGRVFREALDALASLVFPAPCRICETTLLTASRIPIFPHCRASMRPFAGPACRHCGRPFASGQAESAAQPLCHLCRRDVYGFDLARSYAPYDSAVVRAIPLLRYSAVAPLGDWFGARLAELVAGQPELFEADVVVPVP